MQNDNYYIVKKGDTLWNIANKYGLTVNELKKLNNLTSNALSVGQKLLVKDTSSSENIGIYYTVVAGDTLYGIAKRYGLTVDELKKMNNLTSNSLTINQKLLVGGTSGTPSTEQYDTYIVKSGDSLWSIANRYGTTVARLQEINNLTSNLLSVGQRILIPKTTATKTYTVKSGDSLYRIAQTYGTTVSELMRLNNLSSNNLSIGQVLILP